MKILICSYGDDTFKQGFVTMLKSIVANTSNPEGHEITYQYLEPTNNFDYLICHNGGRKGTRISLCRFAIFRDFSEYDRVIHVDSDMLCVNNVDLLLSSELNSKDYWAVKDQACKYYYKDRLNCDPDSMLNGGLQVINKPLLNKQFFNKMMETISPGDSYDGSDQGYLSKLLPKMGIEIGWLPDEYNYAFTDGYYKQLDNPRIVHFTGTKPWNDLGNTNPYYEKWRSYQ